MARKITIDPEQLKELHAQGLTDKEIGAQLGCAAPTICQRRKHLGLESNRRKKAQRSNAISGLSRKAAKIEARVEGNDEPEFTITANLPRDFIERVAAAVVKRYLMNLAK
jgi:hypothetical protein